MGPHLSWKHRFWLLIGATLIGLLLMTLSGLRGLNEVSESYEARTRATAYRSAALSLFAERLKIESRSANLQPGEVEEYEQQIADLTEQASRLVDLSLSLDAAPIAGKAEAINEQIGRYAELRRAWLARSEELGLTSSRGQRARLAKATAEAQNILAMTMTQDDIEAAVRGSRDYLATFDPQFAGVARGALNNLQKISREMDWEENVVGKAIRAFAKEFDAADELVQAVRALQQDMAALGEELETTVEQQDKSLRDGVIARTTQQAAAAQQAAAWLIGGTSLAVMVFLVLTLTQASRILVRRLNEVVRLLAKVAAGDLSGKLSLGKNPRDEFNRLGDASNRMTDDIAGVIRQVIDGNRDLNKVQAQLQERMLQLGRNSQQVEEQTEQAAAAAQEISQTANEILARANTVNQAAHVANSSAQSGSEVIAASVATMRDVSAQIKDTHQQMELLSRTGEKVNSIVDVINGIAEQTNLLALNAAIEAARAGDAGRGFSVVADEVRSLAQKTVAATGDIATIVDSLNRETQQIAALMQRGLAKASESEKSASGVASVIDEITRSIGTVAGDMDQVVGSIGGISATTEEIAQKMEQIHVHTRETKTIRRTLEEQTQQLSSQTNALTRTSERFRLS